MTDKRKKRGGLIEKMRTDIRMIGCKEDKNYKKVIKDRFSSP